MPKYSFDEIKEKFYGQFIECEPELSLYLYDKEYIIIFYGNRCSFQRCGYKDGSGEIFYTSFDELYNTETVDGILLKRDWNDITNFECDDFDEDF